VIVLEKEPRLASHQTGRNSGVIHSGVYYRPGSLKARLCVEGAALLVRFCQEQGIPYRLCGKLILATNDVERARLRALHERGAANGVAGLELIGPERLQELEPHARGLEALRVPGAGIVDYRAVAERFAEQIRAASGVIRMGTRVVGCVRRDGAWRVETTAGEMSARGLVSCAGLFADRLARADGARDLQIVPFRGEYEELRPERCGLIRAMIYPVPDPALPFLGVHFTRSIHGGVHAGPNAVLALKREGYRKRDVDLRDCWEMARFPGFWRMVRRHWRSGLEESWRSCSRAAFVRALQRLVPEVRAEDLQPGGSGVRAQAVRRDGGLADDFDIVAVPQALHVRNVPSPAATACLALARHLADQAALAGVMGK
jgi:L-2-hydroxyglutarate oxidase LhgO